MGVTRHASPSRYAPLIGFSAAVQACPLVFLAGTTAVDAEGHVVGGEDAYQQACEVLRKLSDALARAGAEARHVVQTRVYLTDASDLEAVGRAHAEWFGEARPAATMVVSGLLDPRMRVEIEAVAYVGSD